ncbi:MAG: protoporphyrinogen oxidase HemJ [Rhodothalassiaceae bacterium]
MLAPFYLWIKAGHVIAVIFWMAGMFMLPRFFAYHSEARPGSPEDAAWIAREQWLLRLIINPSMLAAWILGLLLIVITAPSGLWLHIKLAIVLGLSALHGLLARWRREFARGRNRHDSRFYRIVNEIPTLAVIAIVILVIVRPL